MTKALDKCFASPTYRREGLFCYSRAIVRIIK